MLKTHYLFVSAVLQTYINITNLYLCYLRFTFTSIKVTGSKLNHMRIIFLKVCVHCHLVENHYIIITYSSRLLTSEHYSHFLQISLVCLIFFHMYCATAIPVLFIPAVTRQPWSNLRSDVLLEVTSWSPFALPIQPYIHLSDCSSIQLNMLFYIYT